MNPANGNAAAHFVDRHVEEGRADKPAFVECGPGGRSLTYGELASESGRMADLFCRHGIPPEARAAMIVLDQVEFPVIFWGSLRAGVIPVPLNTLLSPDYYEIILDDSRARALFVSHELLPVVAPLLPRLKHLKAVFVIGGEPGAHLSFADELAASETGGTAQAEPDECAFWLYSSGSTGRPKGVRHVHGSLKATADTFGAQVLGIREDDTVLSAAKLFFAYGLGNAMTFPMAAGATAALFRGRPTPADMFAAMAELRPTIFCGVPTLYAGMVAHMAKETPGGLDRLRICVSAGEALPAEIGNRWKAQTGADILDGVGSTEMLHIFLSNAPGDIVYGTSGIAVPGYQVRLVDEAGREVGAGEVGELLVNGPSAADGYWNQRDKSRSTFEGHWTRTGDKYERTADGRFVYCGRTDDMFKVSGIWVSPFEVEQALVSHPDVLEAAVVAHKDEAGLEKPRAFVVLKNGHAPDGLAETLKEHVKAKVGAWKYPRWIDIVPDLPKTATGKVQRFKLREGA
ncbi:benzoate-CoA ligase family protein [Aquibium sp. ELW1220]|uniref:benzoate-CoA ligase family protein n=1 Tax=Aquibium sp. ELW1220 TaxID=2976766 RepID=UPI0025AFE2FF|nr:benzoate-CoA ligase family protein [Aquibium sp. ELW1220]MDN2579296.1 benzoate-CoA ligase family protein [Aquibium sp. ELW1220]